MVAMETPADMLAYIPTLIQREPEEALVILTVIGEQIQAALALQHCPSMDDVTDYVLGVMEGLTQLQPEKVVMVFYTEAESWCSHEPYRHVHDLIAISAHDLAGLDIIPGLLVTGGRFHEYGTEEWHDMAEVKDSVVAAAMVLGGIPLQPPGITIPEPKAATDAIIAAIDETLESLPALPSNIGQVWEHPYTQQVREIFEVALRREHGPSTGEAIVLIACLQRPVLRDRLMVDAVTHTQDMKEFARTITGNGEEPIPARRVAAAMELMDNLMQFTCDRHRLSLLVTQAWLHWTMGRAADADEYCHAALAIDPEFHMASMFLRYITEAKRIPSNAFMGRQ
jgi:hypothetical protein